MTGTPPRPLPIVLAAPHRLPFLTGSLGLASAALWWLAQLGALHLGWPQPPSGPLPAALLHAPVLLLLVYPAFIFGFLLTVFPRWMGQADLGPRRFGPPAILLALGMALTTAALWSGQDALLLAGFALFALGWTAALVNLGQTTLVHLRAGNPPCWHALSALAALTLGLASLGLVGAFASGHDPRLLRWGNVLALSGFLLPVFLTVAHRMIPFFAGNVVKDYRPWRPGWLLAALWTLLALRVAGELTLVPAPSGLAAAGLAGLTGTMAWRWWPRGAAPGLLQVLIWGFAWAPAGFALGALGAAGMQLGLAPTHALALGFAASLLVAMVTRVSHGHSGRPLAMVPLAWLAFGAVQLAAAVRVAAALRGEQGLLLVLGALILAAGTLPWLLRGALIYLTARRDGRPG